MALHTFIHIGDAHFGPNGRQEDRLRAIDQIIAAGVGINLVYIEKRLSAWLWPGDLFHSRSTIADRNELAPRLQQMAKHAPVVIVPGNHDMPGDLDVFARLQTTWPVHVISQPQVLPLETPTGRAAVFCLPYPHRAGLVSAGVDHDQLGQEARAALEPIFISCAAELQRFADDDGAVPLFIGHVNVGGSVSSVGQPQIGLEIELDPSLLARVPAVYKGLNHIHRHQEVFGAVYAGSICRLDFGENEPKGFVEVEYESPVADLGGGERCGWRFREIDVPRQFSIEGRLTRAGFAMDTIDGERQPRPRIAGADVRVVCHYKQADVSALNFDIIHEIFAEARSRKIDKEPDLEHQVRAPEIVAAKTLDEKVKAYAGKHGIAFTPSFEAKLAALQRSDPQTLIATASAELSAAGAQPSLAETAVA